jgi:hypothetical protein
VDGKYIPIDISKGDKSDMDKLSKAKEEKYKEEYLELFSKQAKRNIRTLETAAKTFSDAEFKDWSLKATELFKSQAELLESTYKTEKKKK